MVDVSAQEDIARWEFSLKKLYLKKLKKFKCNPKIIELKQRNVHGGKNPPNTSSNLCLLSLSAWYLIRGRWICFRFEANFFFKKKKAKLH